jgi:predicted amidohydrolase
MHRGGRVEMNKRAVLLISVTLSGMFGAKFLMSVAAATSWEITVVAIQPEFYYYYVNESDYTAYMTEMMEQAVVYQPDIVVFPEYIGEPLLGLQYPDINDYETWEEYCDATGIPIDWNYSYFEAADVTGTAYLNTFSALAVRYAVYTVAGSICLPDGEITGTSQHYNYDKTGTVDEAYNVAYFFDPNGNIIGTQKKVHLWEDEQLYLTPSTEEDLQVFDVNIRGTQVGVGISICWDTWFASVGQILVERGADIIFSVSWFDTPSMNFDPTPWVKETIWTWSQNLVVYGVLSCMVWESTGRSAITAPTQLTQNEDGFINVADTFNSSTVVPGVLNILELLKLRGEPVGASPLDKLGSLAPYIGLAIAILVAAAAPIIYVKRVKRRKKKQ